MPQYKIIDYTFTTAAELARAILEYAGVSYEDVRYDKDKAGDAEKGEWKYFEIGYKKKSMKADNSIKTKLSWIMNLRGLEATSFKQKYGFANANPME